MSKNRTLPWAFGATALLVAVGSPAFATNVAPVVIQAVKHDTSPPMRDILKTLPPLAISAEEQSHAIPNIFLKPSAAISAEQRGYRGPGIQSGSIDVPAPAPLTSFNGLSIGNGGGGVPPDTNGDVSPTHFIQWINTSWAIFDKTSGAKLSGPTAGNSFFAGFGGRCQTTNSGDPLAIWDQQAQRWVMSQFTTTEPASQCVAISTTSDPLGSYYRYEFPTPYFGDYPHIGIWTEASGAQNAYLMVTHEFQSGAFRGAAYSAFERDKMLQGLPAAMVRFPGFDSYGSEPAHLTGTRPAPAGSCAPFVHFDGGTSEYLFWNMCLNWANPTASTVSADPIRVAAGTPFVPNYEDVPQKNSVNGLNAFGTHTMYRANVRAFDATAPTGVSMVINHTVLGSGTQGGIKWVHFDLALADKEKIFANGFDVTAPATTRIVDEGTYSPDSHTRWMGGIAMDGSGNIGVGYNVSSTAMNPEIRLNGRTLDDPPGTLRDESTCTPPNTGAQTGLFSGRGRWGDYASMSIDPADQCTFWYTGEYYPVTASSSWNTRICSFKFPDCGSPTYALVAQTPARIQMCTATTTSNPSFTVRAGVLNGFTGAVTLSANGLPGGVTPSFSVNPIAAPGASTLTLVGGMGLAPGEYAFNASGTSGALSPRTLALSLGVSANNPGQPALTAPANNSTGAKVRPTLKWNAVAGALSYTVEVASDAGFTNIIAHDTVTTNSWGVNVGLAENTAYFWRVLPHNYCGDGVRSTVFQFTTGVPGQCPSGTTKTIVYQDNFQGGVNGWTVTGTGAGSTWTQLAAPAGTGLTGTVWGVPNNIVTTDKQLTSPAITVPATGAMLSYDSYHSFEDDGPTGCWDNAIMEVKAGAGSFNYLSPNHMFTDPYTGLVSAGEVDAGLMAWCHKQTPARRAIVDLDEFNGQSVQLRFRAVSDSNTAAPAPNGMYIANLKVETCQ